MTEGIVAIASRIAQLRAEFGMVRQLNGPATGASGTGGTSGTDFARQLEAAQQAQKGGSTGTGRSGAASGTGVDPGTGTGAGKGTGSVTDPPPVNNKKSKRYGFENLTPATKQLVQEIDSRFGTFPAIGGWRAAEDGGEHPRGRAADFMVSSEGRMPSAAMREKGDQVAEWAKKNAKRLGIKYIIWNQRIWNPLRADEGWRRMEDRGSITQNHKDHVHISMN